jgi:hypothetical protein
MKTIFAWSVSALVLTALALAVFAQNAPAQEQTPKPKENRSFIGPFDPAQEAARALAEETAEKNYKELKDSAAELADLSRKMSDEINRGSKDIFNARIFDNLDKIEKLTKRIRDKAKGPN